MATPECLNCGNAFTTPDWRVRGGQKYCGVTCANEAKKGITPPGFQPGKVTLTCLQCGEDFETWKAWVRRGRRKFCGWECKSAYQKTLTGTESARFGIKHTEETKAKMRDTTRAPGSRNANWTGGKYKTTQGYRYVHKENLRPETLAIVSPMMTKAGYILEHRLIMAIHLGRPLKTGEKVHHINGNKVDNQVENLMIQDVKTHSQEHREIVRRIGELEKENAHLRSLLATYQDNG